MAKKWRQLPGIDGPKMYIGQRDRPKGIKVTFQFGSSVPSKCSVCAFIGLKNMYISCFIAKAFGMTITNCVQ